MKEKISKTYVISDTHFKHYKMQQFCNRPADFENKIIKQWKNTISPQDIVLHLGDVTWGSQEDLKTIIESLPGTKILIRGNHDRNHSNNWFLDAGFSLVVEKLQMSGIIFSHTPSILGDEEIKRGIINVHGHFHNNPVNKWEPELKNRITPNHYLFILENVDYRPIRLDNRITKFLYNSKKLLEGEK